MKKMKNNHFYFYILKEIKMKCTHCLTPLIDNQFVDFGNCKFLCYKCNTNMHIMQLSLYVCFIVIIWLWYK